MNPPTQGATPGTWQRLTYDDYLTLPNDGKRYQILEGELDVTPAPSTMHQKVSARLEFRLMGHVEEHNLGLVLHAPVDVLLDEQNVVQPDIVFVSNKRLPIVEDRYIAGAPDLVVEILSPTTSRIDRGIKSALYARFGVAWYWLVDPAERCLEEYEIRSGGYHPRGRLDAEQTFRPRLFPGLEIELAQLFRP
jgi:Uma2 family endonuclease